MSGSRAFWLALFLVAGFTWGILRLLGIEYSTGAVYPEYSSLRSDPMGAKLLYDSLAGLSGMTVSRNYLPLEFAERHATVLLLGVRAASLDDDEFLKSVGTVASAGARIVLVLAVAPFDATRHKQALERKWHVQFDPKVVRSRPSELYFLKADGWRVLESDGPKLLAIERDFGSGSVVLFARSGGFANESSINGIELAHVVQALGSNSKIVFDEAHFGIAESGSVVGLVRRFRLSGLALGLALCGAVALWRSASAFPPPAEVATIERLSGRTSFAGLVTLLQRHIPPEKLVSVCWEQWLHANRRDVAPERAQRAASIVNGAASRPLDAAREIQALLHVKGSL